MFEKQIQIEAGDHLTLDEMADKVVLVGWDGADILIRVRDGQKGDLVAGETGTGPTVSARVACEVWVPANLPVTIRQVAGNLSARALSAEINAEQVRGNLNLDQVDKATIAEVYGNVTVKKISLLRVVGTIHGSAQLKEVQSADLQNVRGNLKAKAMDLLRVSRIGGNLEAKEIRGSLDVDQVGGNALVKDIGGPLTLDQVAGNMVARDLVGGSKVSRIGGNLTLNGEIGTGCTYHFLADGNALLRLSDETSAYLALRARGKCRSSVELANMEQDASSLRGILGDGGAEIVVEAKGNIMLGSGPPVAGTGLGEEISRQAEESLAAIDLEAIGRQAGEEMEAAMSRLRVKLEGMDWERIGCQTQQAVDRAMERMQRDMERMVEKAAHHQVRVERRAEKEARRQERRERRQPQRSESPSVDQPVEATESGPGPSLDEERLSILRMVEQGQITPEEAEMLLDALG